MQPFIPYLDFTAQGPTIQALNRLFVYLEMDESPHPEISPIVVFLAFSIESYLNSIGARVIPIWDELERLPWKTKISILYDKAGALPNWGEDPLQFAKEVFTLRDKLAHGKPERITGPSFDSEDQAVTFVLALTLGSEDRSSLAPSWYKGITREWAIKAKERHKVLLNHLGGMHNLPEDDYQLFSSGKISRGTPPVA